MRLHRTHFHTKNALALGGQRGQDVALQTAQHEGLQLRLQLLDLHFMIRVGEIELVSQDDCVTRYC